MEAILTRKWTRTSLRFHLRLQTITTLVIPLNKKRYISHYPHLINLFFNSIFSFFSCWVLIDFFVFIFFCFNLWSRGWLCFDWSIWILVNFFVFLKAFFYVIMACILWSLRFQDLHAMSLIFWVGVFRWGIKSGRKFTEGIAFSLQHWKKKFKVAFLSLTFSSFIKQIYIGLLNCIW